MKVESLRSEKEIMETWEEALENPVVSICCTTYNHELYIEEAIRGFLKQKTNFPFEILIHDDASKDSTQEIIQKFELKYPNIIKPIYQIENQYSKGKRVNFTYNYSRAKGKYIALCEGDDYWTDESKLQKQVDILESNERLMLCIHATGVFNISENKLEPNKIKLNDGDKLLNAQEVIQGGGEFGHTSSFVFRRKMIKKPPQWFINYPSGDTPLRLLSAHYGPIYYLDKEMSVYRRGVQGSWTNRVKNNEKFVIHWSKGIVMFEEYDKYTRYEYSQAIKKRISRIAYMIILRLDPVDHNKKKISKYYSRLNTNHKLKYHLKTKLPWFFNLLKKLK